MRFATPITVAVVVLTVCVALVAALYVARRRP